MKPRRKAKRKPDESGRSASELVYFEDRGTVYDGPLDVVWDFIMKDETFHPQAHTGVVRNFKSKALSDVTEVLSWETLEGRKWHARSARFTTIRPALRIQEDLDGPYAGSTKVFVYSPRGPRTVVDVLCYMRSPKLTPRQIEVDFRKTLAGAYREDVPWFRKYVRSLKRN